MRGRGGRTGEGGGGGGRARVAQVTREVTGGEWECYESLRYDTEPGEFGGSRGLMIRQRD